MDPSERMCAPHEQGARRSGPLAWSLCRSLARSGLLVLSTYGIGGMNSVGTPYTQFGEPSVLDGPANSTQTVSPPVNA